VSVSHWTAELPDVELSALVGVGALLGLAWSLTALSVLRVLQASSPLHEQALSLATPVVFAVTLFAGGLAVLHHELIEEAFDIAVWTGLGTLGVPAAVVLSSLWLPYQEFGFRPAFFTLVNAAVGGAILGFLVGLYDAQKRQLRRDLGAEHAHSAQLSRRLSVINRVLRHDMRHQTQLIQGHTQRLEAAEIDPDVAAEEIRHANDRLLDLADQARKLQALFSGDKFAPRPLDLATVAQNACETVHERHATLEVDCAVESPVPIEGTPLLEDVIVELLDNAAVHNPGDRPSATVSIREVPISQRPVRLVVADDGPGIPDTEPAQENRAESALNHSDGFGLWFVRWVVEDTGGTVTVQTPDREGVGTAVELAFPAPADSR
jgi:signal transduction histidine kinase